MKTGNLDLCLTHKQEWKQSHFAEHNCDFCKLQAELKLVHEQFNQLTNTNAYLRNLVRKHNEKDNS